MKTAVISSRCECQAQLQAQLDEAGLVRGGRAQAYGQTLRAPATASSVTSAQVRLGWLCPFCGRNTFRTVARASLVFAEGQESLQLG